MFFNEKRGKKKAVFKCGVSCEPMVMLQEVQQMQKQPHQEKDV